MTTHANAVPADGRLAPDAPLTARSIDEQEPAARVPARPKSLALIRQRQGGRVQVVDHAVPAGCDRAQRVAVEAEPDRLQGRADVATPALLVKPRRVEQGADRRPDGAQPLELGGRRQSGRGRDIVTGQELVRHRGGREVVMRRFGPGGPVTTMTGRAMDGVRQTQSRVGTKAPSNGLHVLIQVTLSR